MAVLTATSLSKYCDISLEFQQKRGWKARCESNELDEGERLMQLTGRFKGQEMMTPLYSYLYPKNLATPSSEMLENSARVILEKFHTTLQIKF